MNIKQNILWVLLSVFCVLSPLSMQGQTAREVLDKTAATLKRSGGIEASFDISVFKGKQQVGSSQGKIYVKGEKFHIKSTDMLSWFNGTTLWTLLNNSDEVNVSNPTAEEIQKINPYTFVNIYQSGYSLKLSAATHEGKRCHEVRLLAKSPQKAIREMRITIAPNTYKPLVIKVCEGKDAWTNIRVKNLKNATNLNDAVFTFNPKNYPQVEVIDLR